MKTQQFAAYAAEAVLNRSVTFASVEEMQVWVDDMRDSYWWHLQRYSLSVLRIEVGLIDRRKARGCAGVGWFDKDRCAGRIELDRDHLNETTALHEIAHVLAAAVHGSDCHDPAWAMTYLKLVSSVMGPQPYLALKAAFDQHGVDYDVKERMSTFAL